MRSISKVSIRINKLRYEKIFHSESGEIGDGRWGRTRLLTEPSDFDCARSLLWRVLEFSQFLALGDGIGEHEIGDAQDRRLKFLFAGRIRADRGNVRTWLEVARVKQRRARGGAGNDQPRGLGHGGGRIEHFDFDARE